MSRIAHGKTQDAVAENINVSRATVINWEAGRSNPDLFQLEDLAEYFGEDLIYRLKHYRKPDLYATLSEDADIDAVRAELIAFLQTEAAPQIIRQLHFLFAGEHGSDPDAVIQEMNAILQIPLYMRHPIASMVNSSYHMALANNQLNCPDCVKPDLKVWEDAIRSGFHAGRQGKSGYAANIKKKEE